MRLFCLLTYGPTISYYNRRCFAPLLCFCLGFLDGEGDDFSLLFSSPVLLVSGLLGWWVMGGCYRPMYFVPPFIYLCIRQEARITLTTDLPSTIKGKEKEKVGHGRGRGLGELCLQYLECTVVRDVM